MERGEERNMFMQYSFSVEAKFLMKALRRGRGLTLTHCLIVQSTVTGKAWWQESVVAGHIVSSQEVGRER